MDPFTLAILGATVGSSALSMFNDINQGEAAYDAAQFNAAIERQNAHMARERAKVEEDRVRRRTGKVIGEATALFASSGVTLEGSPLEVLGDLTMEGEQDALLARFEGEAQARFHNLQAQQDVAEGGRLRQQGYFQAAGDFLAGVTGVGKVAGGGGLRALRIAEAPGDAGAHDIMGLPGREQAFA